MELYSLGSFQQAVQASIVIITLWSSTSNTE